MTFCPRALHKVLCPMGRGARHSFAVVSIAIYPVAILLGYASATHPYCFFSSLK